MSLGIGFQSLGLGKVLGFEFGVKATAPGKNNQGYCRGLNNQKCYSAGLLWTS